MLCLKTESFHLLVLASVDGGQGLEANTLELALVTNVTSNVIKDPLGYTRVGENGETILENRV